MNQPTEVAPAPRPCSQHSYNGRPPRSPRVHLRHLRHLRSTPSGGAFSRLGVPLGSLRRSSGGALGALRGRSGGAFHTALSPVVFSTL
jgi:hypothetical protein